MYSLSWHTLQKTSFYLLKLIIIVISIVITFLTGIGPAEVLSACLRYEYDFVFINFIK